MAITLAQTERIIEQRCSLFMSRVGWTATQLADPIAWSVRALGYTTTGPTNPTDADIAEIPDGSLDALVDVAEMRTLELLEQNFGLVSVKAGEIDQKFGELGDRLRTMVQQKRADVSAMHGDVLAIRLGQSDRKHTVIKAR